MSDLIQKPKLREIVAERITEYIRNQQCKAGTKLPSEAELAGLLDVSRATVRSAIKSLQLSGVLYSRGGSGTYVTDRASAVLESGELKAVMSDRQDMYSLVQSRYIIEPQLAALAAKNASESEIEKLFEILEDMKKNDDIHSLMSNGYLFHQAVAKFSHNIVLYDFFQSVSVKLRGLRLLEGITHETFLEGRSEHGSIAKAIAAGDSEKAKKLMQRHLKKDYADYLQFSEILE